ncbi:MAG: Prepilin-type N-terminal cleavage/methylation protein [Verrucomicrobiaceae bacterium]|nr:Prepilin-type N-terminal cleavage/methylation protein [Verrucomicrobiaceae bacterium]
MKTRLPFSLSTAGFSLFEVLLVVALIGIMTAIVVPTMTGNNQYEAARNRRNAQEMTAVCASAQVAGVDLVVPGDLEATIHNILAGGAPASGVFKGQKFRASGIDEPDALKAITYLQLQGSSLIYQAGTM